MNNRHQQFCDEYLNNGLNATKAYLSVYKTVTEETAKVNGCKLLTKTNIKEYIDIKREETSKTLNITKESLIQDLIDIKNANKIDRPVVATKAIEVINKMQGYNAVEKQEIKLQGDIQWIETKTYNNPNDTLA